MPEEIQVPTEAAKRVLIIEDDGVTLLAIARIVQGAGYFAMTATDGAEAIKAIEVETPDLVLLDINLQGDTFGQQLDGLAVIDWITYRHPEQPIKYIIVSGDDPEKYKARAAAIGALSFIRKPVERDLLLAEIRRAIGDPPDPGAA